jgi:hypothetical protein
MKKLFLTVLAIYIYCHFSTAQKASDVLENGIHVKSDYAIFLKFDEKDKVLKYAIAKSKGDKTNPIKPILLSDTSIFLVAQTALPVYLLPLNPLNFSQTTENKIIVEQINEAATSALGSIINVLNQAKVMNIGPERNEDLFMYLESEINSLQKKLGNNKKANIIILFNRLKALTFIKERQTIDSLEQIKSSIDNIEKYFNEQDSIINKTREKVKEYNSGNHLVDITVQHLFNSALEELSNARKEHKKRLENLQNAYNLAKQTQQEASIGGEEKGLEWCIKLNDIPSKEGKISNFSITIKESGHDLSVKNEIVSNEPKDVLKRTMKIMKFQRFIPEVSVGTVFTFYKYNSYGTTSDSTGQQYIATPTENTVKNINITAMINWNLFCSNSPIHPLIQTGVGINSGIPSFLVGGGLRFSNNSKNRIRITGGLAMTWIKELDKLKVGDKVPGTADIDEDLKYSSSPKFSPYVGLQYNF